MTKPKPKELHKKPGRKPKSGSDIRDISTAAPPVEPKSKMGRPLKLFADKRTVLAVKELAMIHCSEDEAAAVLGVVKQTFIEFILREPEVKLIWDEGQANGRASIRRAAFKKAVKGENPEMLKFLSKNLLGMFDRIENSGPNGGPIRTEQVVKLTDEDRQALRDILE